MVRYRASGRIQQELTILGHHLGSIKHIQKSVFIRHDEFLSVFRLNIDTIETLFAFFCDESFRSVSLVSPNPLTNQLGCETYCKLSISPSPQRSSVNRECVMCPDAQHVIILRDESSCTSLNRVSKCRIRFFNKQTKQLTRMPFTGPG